MSRKNLLPLSLILLVLALFAGTWMMSNSAVAEGDDTTRLKGKAAPEIAVETIDGKNFKLSDQKGSVVVLDFWATWCPPCRKSLPHLNKVSEDKELAKKGLKVFAVNAREDKEKASDYLLKNNLTLNVPLDKEGKAMTDYLIHGIPTTVVVGRDGKILEVFIGFGGEESEKALDDAIASALK